jgi:penicillin-binding protein 2
MVPRPLSILSLIPLLAACAPSPSEHNPTEHADPAAATPDVCDRGELQAAADEALAATHAAGAVIVLELPDAEELAIAQVDGRAEVAAPPGSTLKPFLAAAALDHALIDPNEPHECTGKWTHNGVELSCFAEHGALDLERALATSCNSYFYEAATGVGANRYAARLDRLGLSDLAGTVREVGDGRDREYIARAIGHGAARVSPRALAHAYAKLLQEERPEHGPVRAGMLAATAEDGTADQAAVAGLSVAGKTGTAESDDEGSANTHTWFVGYAPADAPRVLVLVYVEGEGTGGSLAAPVAQQVLSRWSQSCVGHTGP